MNGSSSVALSKEPSTWVIVADDPVSENETERIRSKGASVELKHGKFIQVEVGAKEIASYSDIDWVESIRRPLSPIPQNVGGEGASAIGADRVHSQGLTGKNATVVVIDQGFNTGNKEIDDNIVEARGFGTSVEGTSPRHGTSSAEMVLDVAPDADLYLASISTGVGYNEALDWAVQNDADVVTMSLGFFGQPHDGTGPISQSADEAVERGGFPFVVSTGNQANRHWQGTFEDPDNDGVLEFNSQGDEINYLNSGSNGIEQISRGTVLNPIMNWDDWPTSSTNYNVRLVYVSQPGSQPQEVQSADYDATGGKPSKRIATTAPRDGYYGVMIEETSGSGEEVELFTSNDLLYRTRNSSIASPAAAEKTVGVGAFRYDRTDIESYSSRGPTNDGSQGVTFLAPTCATSSAYGGPYCGTSGAAPHAGGAAAIIRSSYELNRTETEDAMIRASDSVSAPSNVAGAGLLNLSGSVNLLAADDLNIDIPSVVASGGSFRINYTVRGYDAHQVKITPDGFDVNISDYTGISSTTNLGSPKTNSSTTSTGTALFNSSEMGDFGLEVDIIGGTAGDRATIEVRAIGGGVTRATASDDIDITDEHPSGVSQDVFDAVAAQNGDPSRIDRSDVTDMINAFFSNSQVNGVSVTRSDVVSIIGWFFRS
jgi:hypothetical protein